MTKYRYYIYADIFIMKVIVFLWHVKIILLNSNNNYSDGSKY